MSYLSNELLENGLHYNNLDLMQKFEVCMYWDYRVMNIQPKHFEGRFRVIFENAKKLKTRYEHIYAFGVIEDIPEHMDFRSLGNKEFATAVCKELYTLKRIEHAQTISRLSGYKTKDQEQGEIFRLNDLIMDMAKELDKFEKEVQDLNDVARHFAREGKVLFSEFMARLKVEREIEKPETQIYVKQISKG